MRCWQFKFFVRRVPRGLRRGGGKSSDEERAHIFYLLDTSSQVEEEETCTADSALKEENRVLGDLEDLCKVSGKHLPIYQK